MSTPIKGRFIKRGLNSSEKFTPFPQDSTRTVLFSDFPPVLQNNEISRQVGYPKIPVLKKGSAKEKSHLETPSQTSVSQITTTNRAELTPGPPSTQPDPEKMNSNDEIKTQPEKIEARLEEIWLDFDTNNSGTLNKEEAIEFLKSAIKGITEKEATEYQV